MDPLPHHIYLQPESGTSLFLVESALFTTPGSLPTGCWWQRVFGGTTKRPDPIREHDGLPVYGVTIPAPILQEMLHGMKFPPLLLGMSQKLPDTLKEVWSHQTWTAYLEYYGLFVFEEDAKEPAMKKQRLDETARGRFLRRAVAALAATIKKEHPKWEALVAGSRGKIACTFVSTYNLESKDGDRTYKVEVPGDPVVHWSPAYELGVVKLAESEREVLMDEFKQQFHPFNVIWVVQQSRLTDRKAGPFAASEWPAVVNGPQRLLTAGDHDIVVLNIKYTE